MKRFLWAAILALFIHIILLAFGGRFLNRKIVKPLPQTLSFTLVAEQPKPEKAKPLKATAQKEIPAPVPEKKALPPEAPLPPVIEETVPVPEEKPEPEEVIEKEEPPKAEPVKEKPPEPEKIIPKVPPPAEKKAVKITKPVEPKKPAPVPVKKVQKKKKVIKPPTKKKRVKKAPKIEKPRPLPKKETLETPVKMPEKGDIASKQPDDLKKSAVQKEKTPVSSGPKVVKASPAYATNPRPKYPRVARRRGYEGVVMLKVMVDREGKANEVLVLKSSGHGILDRSAVNAVQKWIFTPGTVNGKRAKMWVQVPVRFELKGR